MIPKVQLLLRSLRDGILAITIPLLFAIILKVIFIDIYEITSTSMEPTLLPGDFTLISKMSYGARLLNTVKYFKQNKIDYIRIRGWISIKKGDIFIFNFPRYSDYSDSTPSFYGDCIVKRCYALPRDFVIIKNERINNEVIIDGEINDPLMASTQLKYNLFPHDTSLHWSLENYGPFRVPAKGQTLRLTRQNVLWYKDIIRYENPYSWIKDSTLKIDDKIVLQYTFLHNYYFMVGDNFYNSQDSRYWGFVPEDNIIGKVVMVLFSYGEEGFRWKRILKPIH